MAAWLWNRPGRTHVRYHVPIPHDARHLQHVTALYPKLQSFKCTIADGGDLRCRIRRRRRGNELEIRKMSQDGWFRESVAVPRRLATSEVCKPEQMDGRKFLVGRECVTCEMQHHGDGCDVVRDLSCEHGIACPLSLRSSALFRPF